MPEKPRTLLFAAREEILMILETNEPVCAVSSVSDERKGERLVVLYKGALDVDRVWDRLNQRPIPKLWLPGKEDFYKKIGYIISFHIMNSCFHHENAKYMKQEIFLVFSCFRSFEFS